MYEAFVVGFTIMLGKFLDWYFFSMLSRPIFLVPIVGLLLGDLTAGIQIGASLELIFLGTTFIGGVVPQDIIIGSVFSAAVAIVYGQDPSIAVALSVPLSLLGSIFWNFFKGLVTVVAERFERLIDEKNIKAFNRLWIIQYVTFLLCYFLIGFVGFYLGADAINSLVEKIPEWLTSSLSVAAGMLPAMGMALLMSSLWDKKIAPYFFIGFALAAFFDADLITVGFIGVAVAALVAINDMDNTKKSVTTASTVDASDSIEEDFFND